MYEFRIRWESNIYRLLCFFDRDNKVVITHGFVKKARRTLRLLRTEGKMSDVEKYIQRREAKNPNFRKELDEERRNLRIGMLIRELRLEKGMTQEELAQEVRTTKSAISRLENHAENMTLATLEKVAHALGKVVHIALS